MGQIPYSSTGSRERANGDTRRFSPVDFQLEISSLIEASLASNTKDTYSIGLQCFESFRDEYKLDKSWPPPFSHIILFMAYLSLKGKAYKTVNCYLAAITFRCKIIEPQGQNFKNHFLVCKMLEGLRRVKGTKDQRLPITLELLSNIVAKLPAVCSSLYETLLFSAAFTLAYHGFLRVGEIVYTKAGQLHQIVAISDVEILAGNNTQFIRLTLRHSKCDQAGKGTIVDITSTGSPVCPVRHIKRFLDVRSHFNGPLFCHFNGSCVSRYQFSSVLTKTLRVLGIDSVGYKNHSFRIGAASEWAANGKSEQEIMKMGRWKSGAYKSYIRFC